MTLAIIAAMSKNRIIGNGPDIPWKVKGEQKLFRDITLGGTLIMGRKTYESIGRPLPGRTTIIVTRQDEYRAEGCIICGNLEEALSTAKTLGKPAFVAGGGEIYQQTIGRADEIHLTVIDTQANGDVLFPEFDENRFEAVREQHFESNINYTYIHYVRKA